MQKYLEHFEEYLLAEKCVSPHTHKAYTSDITQLISFLSTKSITHFQAVEVKHLREFLRYLKEAKFSARSMSRKVAAIKLFCRFLAERHGLPNHATTLIFPKLDKRLPVHCAEEDMVRLFAVAEQGVDPKEIRNKTLLYLLYISGLRVSEAVNIKLSDIYLREARVNIKGKGGKTRVIPLPPNSIHVISAYISQARPHLVPKKYIPFHEDYLFPTIRQGKVQPLSRQTAWAIVKKAVHKANIDKKISPHTFRHSIATHLLKSGWDIRSLQIFLGHETITTVEIYTHVDTSYLRSVYNKKHPRS
jgi:integrase/recombinase XerD